jgi:diguanylate cyclase (GGDEF)-like protein
MQLPLQLDPSSINLASAMFLAFASLAVYILRGNESRLGSLSVTAMGLFCSSIALFFFGLGGQVGFHELSVFGWPLMAAAATLIAHGLRSTLGVRDNVGLLLGFFGTASLSLLLLHSNNRELAFNAILFLCLVGWFEAVVSQDTSAQAAKKIKQTGIAVIAVFLIWLLLDSLYLLNSLDTLVPIVQDAPVRFRAKAINRIDAAIAFSACALMVVWSVQIQHRQEVMRRIQLDPLTGLASREYLLDYSEKWLKDHPIGLALMVVDIDHFRAINEQHGHAVGDSVLKHVGKRLKQSVRKDTLIARYGGEEFGLIVPVTNKEEATKVAERLRFEIEQSPFFIGLEAIQLTVSIGLTLYDHNVSLSKALVNADARLHDAKQTGRNRVVAAFA